MKKTTILKHSLLIYCTLMTYNLFSAFHEVTKSLSKDKQKLLTMIFNGNINEAKILIQKNKVNIDFKISKHNVTILHIAICKKIVDLVIFLIENGANINLQANDGWISLHFASNAGSIELTKLLIEHVPNINAKDHNGWTPLHVACDNNFIEIAKIFLEKGADVNITNEEGITPLMMAVKQNSYEITKLLLEYGADINAKAINDTTALAIARHNKFQRIYNLLKIWPTISKYKDKLFKTHDTKEFKFHFNELISKIKKKLIIDEIESKEVITENIFLLLKNKQGNTLLHQAVIHKNYTLINDILKIYPEIAFDLLSTPNTQGMTPIDLSANDECLLNYFMNLAYPGNIDHCCTIL